MRQQEDKHGKPNPVFVRKAREMLHNNNNKFFVSMSVKREKVYKPGPKFIKQGSKYSHAKSKLMESTSAYKEKLKQSATKQREIERRQRSPFEKIDKRERVEDLGRIYLEDQAEPTIEYKKTLDMIPSREDGTKSINDVRSYSAKQRAIENFRNPPTESINRSIYVKGDNYKNYQNPSYQPTESMTRSAYMRGDNQADNRREIEKRLEFDSVVDQYKNTLHERTREPNTYFEKISQGLKNLKKDFGAVSQELEHTSTYMRGTMNKSPRKSQIVARGAGKIVKLYSDKLTEMMLDDLIIEMIPILQAKEEREKKVNQRKMKTDILHECMEALKDLTYEQKRVEERAEEIYTLTTITRNRMKTLGETASYKYPTKILKRKIEISEPQKKLIIEEKEKYKQFRKTTDLYSEKTNIMMDILVRNMLDELTKEVTHQFLEAQEEFVERLLISEFEF